MEKYKAGKKYSLHLRFLQASTPAPVVFGHRRGDLTYFEWYSRGILGEDAVELLRHRRGSRHIVLCSYANSLSGKYDGRYVRAPLQFSEYYSMVMWVALVCEYDEDATLTLQHIRVFVV